MAYLNKIVRLTKEQYAELVTQGSITVEGVTYTYDPDSLYLTDQQQELSIGTVQTLTPGSDAMATITGTAEQPVLNLGIPAGIQGETGATGATGAEGAPGADGVSPTVTVSTITGGHQITITDADHPSGQTVNVMDGETPDVPVESGTGLGAVQTKGFTQYGTDYVQSASGAGAFAEGRGTTASGLAAHAEGTLTTASGSAAHSEGGSTVASGSYSHAQGLGTVAAGAYEHAQGVYNKITAIYPNWTASTSYSIGDKVSRNSSTYECIEANSDATFTSSKWNRIGQGTGDRAFVIGNGNGSSDLVRSNAAAIDWSGDAHFAGNVYVGANADSTGGTMLPRDVQVNGTSVVSGGVANVPIVDQYGSITGTIKVAQDGHIKGGATYTTAITPLRQHTSVFYGLAKAAGDSTQSASSNAVGTYTEDAKSAISEMLSGSVSVSGSTPSITAKPGISYVCGECSTLDITTPATGIVDVVFESGSTPTVLTVTPPSGKTMKWANGFEPSSLEANTTYEINIMDGCLGVAGTW